MPNATPHYPPCVWPGCTTASTDIRHLCSTHAVEVDGRKERRRRRVEYNMDLPQEITCVVEWCEAPPESRGGGLHCTNHLLQRIHDEKLRRKRSSPGAGEYVTIVVDGRSVLEHRHVMEQHLGRKLVAGENVHHLNGQRADNRLSNLELWSVSQPAGQRIEDKVAWAIHLLQRYQPEALA